MIQSGRGRNEITPDGWTVTLLLSYALLTNPTHTYCMLKIISNSTGTYLHHVVVSEHGHTSIGEAAHNSLFIQKLQVHHTGGNLTLTDQLWLHEVTFLIIGELPNTHSIGLPTEKYKGLIQWSAQSSITFLHPPWTQWYFLSS